MTLDCVMTVPGVWLVAFRPTPWHRVDRFVEGDLIFHPCWRWALGSIRFPFRSSPIVHIYPVSVRSDLSPRLVDLSRLLFFSTSVDRQGRFVCCRCQSISGFLRCTINREVRVGALVEWTDVQIASGEIIDVGLVSCGHRHVRDLLFFFLLCFHYA